MLSLEKKIKYFLKENRI